MLFRSVLALTAFPYYLQYAKGNLKYHLIGNITSVFILIPSVVWAATHYGAIGAGWVWFLMQLFYLIFWVSYIHIKIEPNINWIWFKTFLPSVVAVSIFVLLSTQWVEYSGNRLMILLKIIIVSGCSVMIAIFSSVRVLNIVKEKLYRRAV